MKLIETFTTSPLILPPALHKRIALVNECQKPHKTEFLGNGAKRSRIGCRRTSKTRSRTKNIAERCGELQATGVRLRLTLVSYGEAKGNFTDSFNLKGKLLQKARKEASLTRCQKRSRTTRRRKTNRPQPFRSYRRHQLSLTGAFIPSGSRHRPSRKQMLLEPSRRWLA